MLLVILLVVLAGLIVFVVREARVQFRAGRVARLTNPQPRPSSGALLRIAGRFVAAVAIGAAFGSFVHAYYGRMRLGGREAFIAAQANRFDTLISHAHALGLEMVFGVLFAGTIIALYELVSWIFSLPFRTTGRTDVSIGPG